MQYARQHGIKAAAHNFATTVRTVRKWLGRYPGPGPSGLLERSRAPHHQPHQTPVEIEQQGVALRQQLPTFGARRLIREFELPRSHRALEGIWRQHGLLKKRRRKYQRKQDLAAVKATWRPFQQISADTKDLDDIPRYWPQMKARSLPAIQYTAREVRSGLLFCAFAERCSGAASEVFAARIQRHLQRCGISLRDLVWQGRQRRRVRRSRKRRAPSPRLPGGSGGQPARAHPTRCSHLPVRRRTVFLDYYISDSGGYDFPRLPCRFDDWLAFPVFPTPNQNRLSGCPV